jgi:uncharacterized membrane protein
MTQPASSYISLDIQRRLRNQAWRVWALTGLVVFVWVGSIVAAPLFGLSSVYGIFSYVCHQLPDRSIHLDGHSMAVCTRCFGVYFGLAAGVLIYPLWRPIEKIEPIRRFWLFLSLVPVTIDWSLTMVGIWENTHVSRFLTGMILGAACATFIVPALVEITRNFSARKLQTQ